MKKLYIVRGVPGCGKTTFAATICENVATADDYFMVDGEYKFDITKLHKAHKQCQDTAERFMTFGVDLAVANTSTTEKEMKAYYKMAEKYGYTVFSIIVENRHSGKDTHGVPAETLDKMRNRFDIKL